MQLIKKLCETYGPAGREDRIRQIIKEEIKALASSIKTDAMGNLVVRLAGQDKKIMICAHMDEIGLIVSYIDQKGFLRFSAIGGVYMNRLIAQRIVFENGATGTINQETRDMTDQSVKIDKLFIDIGAANRKSAETKVRVGDIAAFHQTVQVTGDRIIGKAMDDRIGCYVMIEAIKKLAKKKSKKRPDLYFVFTVQEEVGLRGAATSSYGIAPDYGLSIDVTGTGDTPESEKMAIGLAKGAAIKVRDRGMITHPVIKEKLISTARKTRIPYQLEVLEWGTTDAAVMQISRQGVPSGTISIPCRYIHSTSEMVDINDVRNTIDLLSAFLSSGIR